MGQRIVQVDSFTDRPFSGNPAAVCIMKEPADEQWMQAVAQEMNLSETAFLYPDQDCYQLRWFTPQIEVDLCGHATLASAHVLWEEGLLPSDRQARFKTRSGLLTADKRGGIIELDFPALATEDALAPPDLVDALGVTSSRAGKGSDFYLVEVDSETTVRMTKPDFSALARGGYKSVVITSQASTPDFDIVSRFFAPGFGIDEDPVTGSAHCCLGPYWQRRLNKSVFRAYQASARGGAVHVTVEGDRVRLGGNAVTVFHGELV